MPARDHETLVHRVAVLTGAGEKAFCTGIDRTEPMGGDETSGTRIEWRGR